MTLGSAILHKQVIPRTTSFNGAYLLPRYCKVFGNSLERAGVAKYLDNLLLRKLMTRMSFTALVRAVEMFVGHISLRRIVPNIFQAVVVALSVVVTNVELRRSIPNEGLRYDGRNILSAREARTLEITDAVSPSIRHWVHKATLRSASSNGKHATLVANLVETFKSFNRKPFFHALNIGNQGLLFQSNS